MGYRAKAPHTAKADGNANGVDVEPTDVSAPAPWWCSPAGIALGFLLPMFGLVSFAIEFDLEGLTARGLRFLTPTYLLLGAALIGVMAYGGWLGARISTGGKHPAPTRDVDRATFVIGFIALLAYVFWFREYLLQPGLLWSILNGSSSPARADQLVTGVTSLANGAPVFFAIYGWRLVMRTDIPLPRRMHVMCALLAGFTAFRVYAWSERLALIEAVLPLALIGAVHAARAVQRASRRRVWAAPGPSRVRLQPSVKAVVDADPPERRPTYTAVSPGLRWAPLRLMLSFGPFLALPLLMLYFGLAESVRSWSSDTYNGKLAFWDFVLGRMATYYYTALNNGAGYLVTQDWPSYRFEYVFSMLHTAPLAIGQIFSALVGSTGQTFDAFLVRYADIEFNNPSGFYTVIYDLGIPLGIAYFAVVGLFAGMLYRRWCHGSLTGALLYPVFFISYLEVFRYPYLGSGRAFAWLVCAGLLLAMVYPARYRKAPKRPFVQASRNLSRSQV